MIIHTTRDRGSMRGGEGVKVGVGVGGSRTEPARERSSMIFISLGQADTMWRCDVVCVFCINVRAHVFACTSVVPHQCVCAHLPHTVGDSLYHVIPVTIVLCSLCLPSNQIINRFAYTTHTTYRLSTIYV